MPEVVAVETLRSGGATAAEVRLFLTFCAAMDRARDADRLARAAVRLHRDHGWTFDPGAVAHRPLRELTAVLREYRVSQRHSADAYGWRLIAETLAEGAAPAVAAVIHEGRGHADQLLTELVSTHGGGTPLLPLLGGPKIGPLWIRLMAHPGGAQIESLHKVPVAVDVQVRKVTEYLVVTDTGHLDLDTARSVIQETWRLDVERHGAVGPAALTDTPGALDPALWFYAKWGCTFCQVAGRKRPISKVCDGCRFPATTSEAN